MKKRNVRDLKNLESILDESLQYWAEYFYSDKLEPDEFNGQFVISDDMSDIILKKSEYIKKKLTIINLAYQNKMDKAEKLFYKKINKITKDLNLALAKTDEYELKNALVIDAMNLVREESSHWAEICSKNSLIMANNVWQIFWDSLEKINEQINLLEIQNPENN